MALFALGVGVGGLAMVGSAGLTMLVRWHGSRSWRGRGFVAGLRALTTTRFLPPPAPPLAEADTVPQPVASRGALYDDTVLLAQLEPAPVRYVGVAASTQVVRSTGLAWWSPGG
jgi:hypothetical protein